MAKQVFLGGACGLTTWRTDIAIPRLEAAGVTYCNPQLGLGEWTAADHEEEEMLAKLEADVLLFVISGQTRGVASVAEVAYLIAAKRAVAIAMEDVPYGAVMDGRTLEPAEVDDINRGRIFVSTMAGVHGVPIFASIADAVDHAINLVKNKPQGLSITQVREVLSEIKYGEHEFLADETDAGFLIWVRGCEPDSYSGVPSTQIGRRWHINRWADKDEVVRTALKAVLTWQEHEAREKFFYKGARIFGPHQNVDELAARSSV